MRRLGAVAQGGHHDIRTYGSVVQEGDLVMSTVRNHFDWFASFWELNDRPGKFDRFVPKFCRESEWIRRNPDRTRCELYWKYAPLSTVILRYERIERDFKDAMVSHGFPEPILEQNGPAKPQPYMSYYKPETIQLVQNLFNDELAKYGYQFG